jgi:hypothetical protein
MNSFERPDDDESGGGDFISMIGILDDLPVQSVKGKTFRIRCRFTSVQQQQIHDVPQPVSP